MLKSFIFSCIFFQASLQKKKKKNKESILSSYPFGIFLGGYFYFFHPRFTPIYYFTPALPHLSYLSPLILSSLAVNLFLLKHFSLFFSLYPSFQVFQWRIKIFCFDPKRKQKNQPNQTKRSDVYYRNYHNIDDRRPAALPPRRRLRGNDE